MYCKLSKVIITSLDKNVENPLLKTKTMGKEAGDDELFYSNLIFYTSS